MNRDAGLTAHWLWLGVRPRTLSMSAAPVVLGAALAWSGGGEPRWWVFLATLLSALAIQAGTNLYNDLRDGERGADGPERVGPVRVTAAGLASPGQVRRAALASFLLAFVTGLALVVVGGWPILAIGITSLAAGYAYSGGPRPLSHTPWGEAFVLLFFGVLAVVGTHYLQAGSFSTTAAWLGCALGLHAAAVLLVNNVRDLDADRLAGRATLAGVLGRTHARRLYAALLLLPFVVIVVVPATSGLWLPWLLLPPGLWLAVAFMRMPAGTAMNVQLARSAQLQALFAVALSAGLLLRS